MTLSNGVESGQTAGRQQQQTIVQSHNNKSNGQNGILSSVGSSGSRGRGNARWGMANTTTSHRQRKRRRKGLLLYAAIAAIVLIVTFIQFYYNGTVVLSNVGTAESSQTISLTVNSSPSSSLSSSSSSILKTNDIDDSKDDDSDNIKKDDSSTSNDELPDSSSIGMVNNSIFTSMEDSERMNNNGKFFSASSTSTTIDYKKCTSPERDVTWPLEGVVKSHTSSMTCGMRSTSPFSMFFKGTLWKTHIRPLTTEHCQRLIVFGVAFGTEFMNDLNGPNVQKLVNSTNLLRRHGRCFFIFALEDDVQQSTTIHNNNNDGGSAFNTTSDELSMIGHNILIPIPKAILPYSNPRRNVKLLKYMGQFMFRQTQTVIWQDAKFFRDEFLTKQPANYESLISRDTCVSAVGLPVNKQTVGLDNIRNGILQRGKYHPQYVHHCETIINALTKRPNVTDSADNLIHQCEAYLQHVYLKDGRIDPMNQGLIDSAFIVWNQHNQKCKDFNAALRCTIMDQVQCHSDRDQVSIPFALYTMGLTGHYSPSVDVAMEGSSSSSTKSSRTRDTGSSGLSSKKKIAVDRNWDPRIHDLDFVESVTVSNSGNVPSTRQNKNNDDDNEEDDVMFRVIRSSCHWYFSRLGNCRTDLNDNKKSVALLVAGTAKRYMFEGLVDHVINPLVNVQGHKLDYYCMLSVKQGLAYRSDEPYMRLQTYDPTFQAIKDAKDAQVVTQYMYDTIRDIITHTGGHLGGIHIQPQPMKLDPPELRQLQKEAKKERPKEDSYFRFPTLDLRKKNRRKTAVSNRNLFKLYLGLQKLWEKHLITSEHYIGVHYDYVMMIREDARFLSDFNLEDLLASNPNADAYILSCDSGESPPNVREYNDFAIVIKREKAIVIGKYFTELIKTQYSQCHESVRDLVIPGTGCNSGMLFYWILQRNNITIQKVPQSLLPFERSMTLDTLSGGIQVCIHKYCQSTELPMEIPSDMKRCSDLNITADELSFHRLQKAQLAQGTDLT